MSEVWPKAAWCGAAINPDFLVFANDSNEYIAEVFMRVKMSVMEKAEVQKLVLMVCKLPIAAIGAMLLDWCLPEIAAALVW